MGLQRFVRDIKRHLFTSLFYSLIVFVIMRLQILTILKKMFKKKKKTERVVGSLLMVSLKSCDRGTLCL